MQFALDEDRALLARSTRELLEKEAPLATNRQIMESERRFQDFADSASACAARASR